LWLITKGDLLNKTALGPIVETCASADLLIECVVEKVLKIYTEKLNCATNFSYKFTRVDK